jgi:stage II sporulation protein AA (anti-sigma F factor antagonist)
MKPLVEISIAPTGKFVIARLNGEIDISSAPRIHATLTRAVPNAALGLVVDLSAVSYLDSAGIRLLFDVKRELQYHRQCLRLVVPEDAPIQRLVEIVNLGGHVALHRTLTAALAAP